METKQKKTIFNIILAAAGLGIIYGTWKALKKNDGTFSADDDNEDKDEEQTDEEIAPDDDEYNGEEIIVRQRVISDNDGQERQEDYQEESQDEDQNDDSGSGGGSAGGGGGAPSKAEQDAMRAQAASMGVQGAQVDPTTGAVTDGAGNPVPKDVADAVILSVKDIRQANRAAKAAARGERQKSRQEARAARQKARQEQRAKNQAKRIANKPKRDRVRNALLTGGASEVGIGIGKANANFKGKTDAGKVAVVLTGGLSNVFKNKGKRKKRADGFGADAIDESNHKVHNTVIDEK